MLALMAAVAVVLGGSSALGGPESAWAGSAGDVDTFAKDLPMAEVHLDPAKLKKASKVEILDDRFAVEGGYVVLNQQIESNQVYGFVDGAVKFTFANAAIRSDGATRDVVVTMQAGTLLTGPAGGAKGDTTKTEKLAGHLAIAKANGTAISARVLADGATEGSTEWRYGFQAIVTIAVSGIGDGSFVWGATGMTIDRSGTKAFQNVPYASSLGYFSEAVDVLTDYLPAPVAYPQESYAADVDERDGLVTFSGDGVNGSEQSGIDDKRWDYSFLTGFLTEASASDGAQTVYRCGGGLSGSKTYTANMFLFPEGGSYAFETSSGEGGRVEFTKNGGDLNDGSAVLEAGRYSAPRGKSVRLTMTPDQAGSQSELKLNDVDVSGDIVAHGEGANVYYTYDVPAAYADTTAEVTWSSVPVPSGNLGLRLTWADGGESIRVRPWCPCGSWRRRRVESMPLSSMETTTWMSRSGLPNRRGHMCGSMWWKTCR